MLLATIFFFYLFMQEGVEKFYNHLDSNMPWKTILEFGTGVFEKSRTAGDLKDKWRNMSK